MDSQNHDFPVEIYEAIFKEVNHEKGLLEYYRTIKSCRAVCKLFERMCTPLLFRYGVEVAEKGHVERERRLQSQVQLIPRTPAVHLLQKHSTLLHSIRHMSLVLPKEPTKPWVPDWDSEEERELYYALLLEPHGNAGPDPVLEFKSTPDVDVDAGEWLTSSPFMDLPALCSLSIDVDLARSISQSQCINPLSDSWHSRACKMLLDQYTRSGALSTLSLAHMINIPILRIIECPTLVDLKLHACSADATTKSTMSSPATVRPSDPKNLYRYKVDYCDEVLSIQIPRYLRRSIQQYDLDAFPSHLRLPNAAPVGGNSLRRTTFPKLAQITTGLPLVGVLKVFMIDDVQPAFPALKRLSCPYPDAQSVQVLLEMLTDYSIGGLEHLTLTKVGSLTQATPPQGIPLHLSKSLSLIRHTLQYLSFDTHSYMLQGRCDFYLNELCLGLEGLRYDNVLTTFKLAVELVASDELLNSELQISSESSKLSQWTRLSCLLSERASFPDLTTVDISLDYVDTANYSAKCLDKQQVEKTFCALLSHLQNSPYVELCFSVNLTLRPAYLECDIATCLVEGLRYDNVLTSFKLTVKFFGLDDLPDSGSQISPEY
ncbi:hypothetical protein CVT24_009658 [Panaeolus cyanescens]|uniref:F-box domain-containing protein n=1 Tax=Panaeolus cyanescens TaxID=181874 RepID=A0A409Y9V0_9AGAR|nr:hypothetical protein CVT24_009658 [Panaeolus cyanescens]